MKTPTSKRKPPTRKVGQGKGLRTFSGEILDITTVANEFLGGSRKTVQARVARRMLPFRRYGGRILFVRKEIEEFFMKLPGCSPEEAIQNIEDRPS